MVYSDRMQLSEARELLGRAVALDPGDANAQVALGIAALRDNDPEAALFHHGNQGGPDPAAAAWNSYRSCNRGHHPRR